MTSSTPPFPDPWESDPSEAQPPSVPNNAEAAASPEEAAEDWLENLRDQENAEIEDDFGLGELEEMLAHQSEGSDSPSPRAQSSPGSDPQPGTLPEGSLPEGSLPEIDALAAFGLNPEDLRSPTASPSVPEPPLTSPAVPPTDVASGGAQPDGASPQTLEASVPESVIDQAMGSPGGDLSPRDPAGASDQDSRDTPPELAANLAEEADAPVPVAPQPELTPALAGAGSAARSAPSSETQSSRGDSRSTYRRFLGNRRQISAFLIILGAMGGILSHGLTQGTLPGTDWFGATPSTQGPADAKAPMIVPRTPDPEEPPKRTTAAADQAPPETSGGGDLTGQSPGDRAPTPSRRGETETAERLPQLEDEPASPSSLDISDVPPEHWAYASIQAMHKQGIVPNFPDGRFQPDKPVTRAELAASLQLAFKGETGPDPIAFQDIPDDYWARGPVTYAVNAGFMQGYSADSFRPNEQIPRYQVLVTLASGLNLEIPEDPSAVLANYSDFQETPRWAWGQVAAAAAAGLVAINPAEAGQLSPNRPATRAEANAMLYQGLSRAGKLN
ncbi:S-layer homology domain-containing protein [Lyngbya confervoides]|uniref:S-layer homology domain-containing protein n=1 Tax=Lyngbya confervoides BDU141951 TaxID=1574623 RepID=A0ABD4T4Z4_9CYAN|nr:S-layer homology domain-containing protein [Lyngbya confervoides]MCM1983307.1 S-layer homology domain-containing protein [Lyngbya confervoides BDU141951]